jgi:hypothetical protein
MAVFRTRFILHVFEVQISHDENIIPALNNNHKALLRKVTVKLSLHLLTLCAIKAYGGVELQLHPF